MIPTLRLSRPRQAHERTDVNHSFVIKSAPYERSDKDNAPYHCNYREYTKQPIEHGLASTQGAAGFALEKRLRIEFLIGDGGLPVARYPSQLQQCCYQLVRLHGLL